MEMTKEQAMKALLKGVRVKHPMFGEGNMTVDYLGVAGALVTFDKTTSRGPSVYVSPKHLEVLSGSAPAKKSSKKEKPVEKKAESVEETKPEAKPVEKKSKSKAKPVEKKAESVEETKPEQTLVGQEGEQHTTES